MRVYIAGPVTSSGTQAENMYRAGLAAQHLIREGHTPFVPNLYWVLEAMGPIDREVMMEQCKSWLLQCEAMVRLPGPSLGADQEELWASEACIPVFKMSDERIGDFMTPVRSFLDAVRTGKFAAPEAPSLLAEVERVMNRYQIELIKPWLENQPFYPTEPWEPVMGMAEEVGEACHAMLKMKQGIRGSEADHRAALLDALGDIVFFGAGTAIASGSKLGTAIRSAATEVLKRDWKANPATGRMTGAERMQPGPYSEKPRHPSAGE